MIKYREIEDIDGDEIYLRRWNLHLGRFSIKLHHILRNDHDRCEHDHPWNFIRIILWGGYVEEVNGKKRTCKPWRPWAPWRVYPVSGTFKHRVDTLVKGSSWSLILCGPRIRDWGFFTKHGWMDWRKFVSEAKSKRILWCEDGRILNKDKF